MVNSRYAFSLIELICVLGLIGLAIALSVRLIPSTPTQQRWPTVFEQIVVRARTQALIRQTPVALAIPTKSPSSIGIVALAKGSASEPWETIDIVELPGNAAFIPELSARDGNARLGKVTLQTDPHSGDFYYWWLFNSDSTPALENAKISLANSQRTITYRLSSQGALLQ